MVNSTAVESTLAGLQNLPTPVSSWQVETGPDATEDPAVWVWVMLTHEEVDFATRTQLRDIVREVVRREVGDAYPHGEIDSKTDIRALGLVVDKVDKIMHGMELGTAGMHNQVRQTVARAARRILRAYIDWGVLQETNEKGICHGTARRVIDDPNVAVWTIKALLFAVGDKPRSATALLRGPHLFPFDVALPSMRDLECCEGLEVSRHGLNQEVLLGLSEPDEIQH